MTFKDITDRLKGSGKTAFLQVPLPKKFKPDAVLLEVELNGKKRTINIENLKKIRAYFDITADVKMGTNGHPEFDSIAGITRDLVNDLWQVLRGVYAVQQN